MKNRFLIVCFVVLSLVSCRTSLNVANVQTQKNKSITSEIKEDQNFVKVIEPYKIGLEKNMNTKLSHTNADLNKKGDNSNLGNLLADFTYEGAQVWAKNNNIPNVDAAVINIGGIRSSIGVGDILTKHVFEVMPFENEVVLVKMKGSDLQGLFDYYVKTSKNNPVSHLYIETENGTLKSGLINGKSVDANKTYYIATSDYLALGGDSMKFFSSGEMISTGIKLRDLFIEYFKKNPETDTNRNNDIRLNFIGKKGNE